MFYARASSWTKILLAVFFLTLSVRPSTGQTTPSGSARGVEVVERGGYPELHVDGKPFFIHSGAFFYTRVRRDEWSRILERYRDLGINTIDIYIPWNWHEPHEGEWDFDGHTNPRRDLRGLIRLITEKGFRLIVRPGPLILNEWRHGGYPGWLLERPEYHMDAVDRLEGRYPSFANLNTRDAEAAAQELLSNVTHMEYAQKWLAAVAKELAPFSASRITQIAEPTQGSPEMHDFPGPLLFVQLEDDLAIGRTNRVGPAFWQYLEALRGMLEAGGLNAPVFINPTDMIVSAAGAGLPHPIGVMGQWYLPQGHAGEAGEIRMSTEDAATIEFYTEELKTQPAFPPAWIEYQAGWYAAADDDRPLESAPANTLLSSRLAIGYGLHGLNYFPLQDTFTPAGYSVPWANRSYRWDAGLGPNGNAQPRSRAINRNGRLIEQWGEWLASSHLHADFGLINPAAAYPWEQFTAANILSVSRTLERIERVALLASLSTELVDPEHQPVEQFLRHPLLLLPVFRHGEAQLELSEKAQLALVEYVRRGGTLIFFPERPSGEILEQLWAGESSGNAAPPAMYSALAHRWKFGAGEVMESTKDFFSWADPGKSLAESREQEEANWATGVLEEFLHAAGGLPEIKRGQTAARSGELIVSVLLSDEGTGMIGTRAGGQGMLSVTNLSALSRADEVLDVLAPGGSARGSGNAYLPLRLTIPPHESLLLPLGQPLCSAARAASSCHDAVLHSGAELLHIDRKGQTLNLIFYAPARADVALKLEQKPSRVSLEESFIQANWSPELHECFFTIPRGAAPDFLRHLKIELPYKPHVPEKPREKGGGNAGLDYAVVDAVRLPLGKGSSLASDPPLVVLAAGQAGRLLARVDNLESASPRDVSVKLDGPLRGSADAHVPAHGTALIPVRLKSASGEERIANPFVTEARDPGSGLLKGTIEVRSGETRLRSPVSFVVVGAGAANHYEYDFDGDGEEEWVLENAGLRLIISPESGGSALALVAKESAWDLISGAGALHDRFSYAENPQDISPERARGRFGLFNRAYQPAWEQVDGQPVLRLGYDAPDILPAGASIEKRIRLESTDTVRVDYRVQLLAPSEARGQGNAAPQSFIAVNSAPVALRGSHATRFCWTPRGAETHCENFSPGRVALELPASVARLEVRTAGRPGLALEWQCRGEVAGECGRMTIEMKNFSALLQLQFLPLTPGEAACEYSVFYRVLPSEEAAVE